MTFRTLAQARACNMKWNSTQNWNQRNFAIKGFQSCKSQLGTSGPPISPDYLPKLKFSDEAKPKPVVLHKHIQMQHLILLFLYSREKQDRTKTHKCPLHQFSNPSLSLAHSWTQLRRHLKHIAWLFSRKGPVQHAAPLPVPNKTKSREFRSGSSGAQTSDKNFSFKNGNSSNLFCYF